KVGDALQEEDALGQVAGVLHLADGFLVILLRETVVSPVLAHLGVQEVLVDADELAGEHVVQRLDDLLAPLHAPSEGARLAQRPRGNQAGWPGGLRARRERARARSGLNVVEADLELALEAREARSAIAAGAVTGARHVVEGPRAAAHGLADIAIGDTPADA